ncbi:MAG TPA: hypothetical protein VM658_05910 [bacterium]|nr:hypothetical protein [bacterium]
MRKILMALLAAAVLIPGLARADVNAGAGNIVLLGHIDFVGRYSADDVDEGWNGYDTYNLEFAVLGVAGQVGDNVDWVITEAFVFQPYGSLASALANIDATQNTNAVTASLLDARINIHLGENLTFSAGRFIPPTSMTWNPHLLKAMYTINYPLLNGSGLQNVAIPLPIYQTGVMLTAKMGPASLMIGNFNGSDIVGGTGLLPFGAIPTRPPHAGGIVPLGLSNVMDIDKTKGTSVKLAVDSEGLHAGGWYYGEQASVKLRDPVAPYPRIIADDANIEQWGAELCYNSDLLILQGQYLSTRLNFNDPHTKILYQSGWYVLLGANIGDQGQAFARYDYFDYDNKKVIANDAHDQEAATTIGGNYNINDNTKVGVNYTFRDIEGWDANTDELAVIVEVNLF